jgi:putative hydrolase of the HAD superfamily
MQADRISERDYWLARTREVGRLLGEDWDRHGDLRAARARRRRRRVIRPEAAPRSRPRRPPAASSPSSPTSWTCSTARASASGCRCSSASTCIVDATHTQILKPDPRAYDVLDELGLPAEACVFVDDQQRNVDGGLRAGLRCVHFDVHRPADGFGRALDLLGVARPTVPDAAR